MPDHPSNVRPACRVEVELERELPRGWVYEVVVHVDGSAPSRHTVSLAWCDHDYWSGGRSCPSKVVQAALEYALERTTQILPAVFDAARIRRWLPEIDTDLRVDP
ncbi:MAG: hypothetical protein KF859_00930 [Phycisphaeraceae bacterium]|nr:hypothetical protein [Phycisphaeraceae bacterium]